MTPHATAFAMAAHPLESFSMKKNGTAPRPQAAAMTVVIQKTSLTFTLDSTGMFGGTGFPSGDLISGFTFGGDVGGIFRVGSTVVCVPTWACDRALRSASE